MRAGYEVSTRKLAESVVGTVGFESEMVFDKARPDGSPGKRMHSSPIAALGSKLEIPLKPGIADAIIGSSTTKSMRKRKNSSASRETESNVGHKVLSC